VVATRRGLLGTGAIAALAAAGCGERTPDTPVLDDADVLGTLLAIEGELALGWARLRGGPPELAHDVLARVREHVSLLRAAGADDRRGAPAAVAAAARRGDGLDALLALERAAGRASLTALAALRGPDARVLATALYAAGAQRAAIVLDALGHDPFPDAFAGSLS
jgi:hypothetical protein